MNDNRDHLRALLGAYAEVTGITLDLDYDRAKTLRAVDKKGLTPDDVRAVMKHLRSLVESTDQRYTDSSLLFTNAVGKNGQVGKFEERATLLRRRRAGRKAKSIAASATEAAPRNKDASQRPPGLKPPPSAPNFTEVRNHDCRNRHHSGRRPHAHTRHPSARRSGQAQSRPQDRMPPPLAQKEGSPRRSLHPDANRGCRSRRSECTDENCRWGSIQGIAAFRTQAERHPSRALVAKALCQALGKPAFTLEKLHYEPLLVVLATLRTLANATLIPESSASPDPF